MEQQFGETEVCFRTLDLYTSAVLEASLNPTQEPKQEYREAMALMSKVRSQTLNPGPVHQRGIGSQPETGPRAQAGVPGSHGPHV